MKEERTHYGRGCGAAVARFLLPHMPRMPRTRSYAQLRAATHLLYIVSRASSSRTCAPSQSISAAMASPIPTPTASAAKGAAMAAAATKRRVRIDGGAGRRGQGHFSGAHDSRRPCRYTTKRTNDAIAHAARARLHFRPHPPPPRAFFSERFYEGG